MYCCSELAPCRRSSSSRLQGFVSRANANWSAARAICRARSWWRYVADPLAQPQAADRRGSWPAGGPMAAAFILGVMSPKIVDSLGGTNALEAGPRLGADGRYHRPSRPDWSSSAASRPLADQQPFPLLRARRLWPGLFPRAAGRAPLTMWLRGAGAGNHAEATAPQTAAKGGRGLAVAYQSRFKTEMAADFTRVEAPEIDDLFLDRKHQRRAGPVRGRWASAGSRAIRRPAIPAPNGSRAMRSRRRPPNW